ncbi:MAG: hybrid sensor histidine kinase/response regulator [Planctomycetes bacterium]|nr:hybrid sensor histidine kinase/response regulator [Planctomycetota bacterium]
MPEQNNELVVCFVEEATETLSDIENDFLAIEEGGANIDTELVNKIFRGIHSMKGSSGFLGLKSIGTLAHEMENVLNLIRNQELAPNHKIVDALLNSSDKLRGMINNVETSNEIDVSDYLNKLKASITEGTSTKVQESLNRDVDILLPGGGLAFVMVKEMELVLRQRQGQHIYVVEADFIADVQLQNRTPMDFLKAAYQHGELIDSYMSTAGIGDLSAELPDSFSFFMILASKLDQEGLAGELLVPSERVYHIANPEQTSWEQSGPQVPHEQSETNPGAATPQAENPIAQTTDQVASVTNSPTEEKISASPAKSESAATSNIPTTTVQSNLRVSVKVLDTLMNLAGELVLSRNQLLQEADTKDHHGIESVAARIDQVTSELQEAIMQTRMQPIGTVFNKFPRIVRDLSSNLGKQCDLTIEGHDVEMDKTIIEAIGDPLTHLVRNSIDHGIEDPKVRSGQGKNPSGTIVLKAYHQAGKVNIAIDDDGAGINPEKLKTKAIEKGIINKDIAQEMGDREAVRLIFHPGFSMAAKVTNVSGRGVGMDVVKTNIERLGGTVDIDTEMGKGTSINVKLPLTLAIIPSLVVRSGVDKFAIPQVNISELVRIKASDVAKKIERLKDVEVLRLRGKLLPLIRLSKALELQSKYRTPNQIMEDNDRINIADRRCTDITDQTDSVVEIPEDRSDQDRRQNTNAGAMSIIVVESGLLRYGVIVDELFDSKEIVVKPLGRHMKNCPCLAGATILGDGNVSLILDVAGIAAHLKLTMPDTDELHSKHENQSRELSETQSVLIFNNDPEESFGIPTSFISRIERIKTDQIDTVGGQEVLQYRGVSLPILSLENHIKAKPRPDSNSVYVVVYKISNIEVGLTAPELVDISEIPTDIDTTTFREPGVVGSNIVGGRTVRLIDVFELAEKAHPEWATHKVVRQNQLKKAQTILLAEDSSFFRQQMCNFLEAEGFQVIACEDGQVAWEKLQEFDDEINLIVTDIEMPKLDGLGLCHKIKAEPNYSHLPIIAVTSLAGEENQQKGFDAGIDDYQVKLDREQLIVSVRKYLKQVAANVNG